MLLSAPVATRNASNRSAMPGLWWAVWLLGLIWAVFFLDALLPLERLGLQPRSVQGLAGIVAMPFLHANLAHLVANTVPLIVLIALLAIGGRDTLVTTVLVVLLSGAILWVFGRSANHIGASALVFGLAACLVADGWRVRSLTAVLLAGITLVLYGATLLVGVLPVNTATSWDGHLSGVVAGVLVSRLPVTVLSRDGARVR